ncbi:programmed cell death protein [Capsaspora owczarzaki ATCC 30864]|uniref:Programmed cell death protein n=1 Tax=Capsaspora owczarzaki (strain ATCC 30864) TaxID=595528 RepID=A0A0D2UP80_CAPO3|nr:programmed cell death protein [Capsaspora owczarzaki ATCC 30864]KJE96806.1 programmed cell death protein [Capsaspora owczarzaki ATCC 30864]|eukprot:XP_004343798.1 programmed cell death protein [Capsaspora owczarzaki ATCC 30864]
MSTAAEHLTSPPTVPQTASQAAFLAHSRNVNHHSGGVGSGGIGGGGGSNHSLSGGSSSTGSIGGGVGGVGIGLSAASSGASHSAPIAMPHHNSAAYMPHSHHQHYVRGNSLDNGSSSDGSTSGGSGGGGSGSGGRRSSREAIAIAAAAAASMRGRRKRNTSSGSSRKIVIKKGGAGGKTVWGKPGCEIDAAPATSNDPRDPNYVDEDEEEEDEAFEDDDDRFDPTEPPTRSQRPRVGLPPKQSSAWQAAAQEKEECQRLLQQTLPHYMLNGDPTDIVDALEDANFSAAGVTIVAHIIEMALDRKDCDRELAAILVATLVAQRIVGSDDVANAFESLLARLSDIVLDTPHVVQTLAKFIARAVADDILPPVFVTRSHSGSNSSSAASSFPASPSTPSNTPIFRPITSSQRTLSTSVPTLAIPIGAGSAPPRKSSTSTPAPANSIDERAFLSLHAALLSTSPREAISALEAAAANYAAKRHNSVSSTSMSPVPEPDLAVDALHLAKTLINMKHGFVRLDNVFGVNGGRRTVKQLSKQIGLLLREYLFSDDLAEAERCVRELEVPHFHHEIVYEAIIMMMERPAARDRAALSRLLGAFARTLLLTPDQIEQGVARVYEELPELAMDIPNAAGHLDECMKAAITDGWISQPTLVKLAGKAAVQHAPRSS